MSRPRSIVVINDNMDILQLFNDVLEREGGYEVETISTYDNQLIDHIKEAKPDSIISDHVFGGEKHGWDIVQMIKFDEELDKLPLIICSAAVNDLRDMQDILEGKNIDVIFKPFDVDELLEIVKLKLGEPVVRQSTN